MLYRLILKIRHSLYNKGVRKSYTAEVPTICVGNITVGGTGKTPHVEMILRMLEESPEWSGKHIAVLSRGYKRKSKGFQEVTVDGSAEFFGDEPLQIKKKFPSVTVAVCKDRVVGCRILCHPEGNDFKPADLIILDDAFQYRRLKATKNVILVDYNHPIFKDKLLPFGRLRDLPSRIGEADVILVTKCPAELDDWEKVKFCDLLGVDDYSPQECTGTAADGHRRTVLFTTVNYCDKEMVFETGDPHYFYTKKLVLVTGIARDDALRSYLSDTYRILRRFSYPDHHSFKRSDIGDWVEVIKAEPTAAIGTTEKDAQRILAAGQVPETIKARIFCVPIKSDFLTPEELSVFTAFLNGVKRS
ncbi:MAG: tetraacyldisaccharide 4'-kinase [Bacteroidia bacterium]|nr:tetraacyldisaccharide 4'-kinase [Bacteroidia bacterium]